MRTRPRILLDVDGVLTHGFVELVCKHLAEFGFNVTFDQVDQWDIMKAFQVPPDVEQEVYQRMKLPGVANSFTPIDGSIDFVKSLREWADVYIVTSPMGGPNWAHDREEWLYKHYGIPAKKVASVREKLIVRGDVFVDDKLSHLVEWSKEHPEGKAVLFRIPPNRHDAWPHEASTYADLGTHVAHLKTA